MPAVALLDRNGVYGAQRFSVAAREKNVRPIIGSELTLEDDSVLPVLVKDRTGYKNFCELLTQAHLRSEKASCLVRWSELEGFSEGLVALPGVQAAGLGSAGCQPAVCGSLPQTSSVRQAAEWDRLAACAPQSSADRVQRLIDTFGRENIYIEIQRHFIRGEESINGGLIDLADHYRLPLLATNGVSTRHQTAETSSTFLPASASTLISMLPENFSIKTANAI